jgi:Ca2+-binding EF-hand superfamily protein
MTSSKILLAGIILAVSLSANAHKRHQGADHDRNDDGQTSADEMIAARTAKFDLINADGSADGISFAELQAWIQTKHNARFTGLDANGDTLISLDEYLANKPERKKEFLTRVFNLANTTKAEVPPETDPATVQEFLDATEFAVLGPQPGQTIFRFAKLDKNGDGFISLDEFVCAPGHHRGEKRR